MAGMVEQQRGIDGGDVEAQERLGTASCEALEEFFIVTGRSFNMNVSKKRKRGLFEWFSSQFEELDLAGSVMWTEDHDSSGLVSMHADEPAYSSFSLLATPSRCMDLPRVDSLRPVDGWVPCLSKKFDLDTTYVVTPTLEVFEMLQFEDMSVPVVKAMTALEAQGRLYVDPQPGGPPLVKAKKLGKEYIPPEHAYSNKFFLGRVNGRDDTAAFCFQTHRRMLNTPARRVASKMLPAYWRHLVDHMDVAYRASSAPMPTGMREYVGSTPRHASAPVSGDSLAELFVHLRQETKMIEFFFHMGEGEPAVVEEHYNYHTKTSRLLNVMEPEGDHEEEGDEDDLDSQLGDHGVEEIAMDIGDDYPFMQRAANEGIDVERVVDGYVLALSRDETLRSLGEHAFGCPSLSTLERVGQVMQAWVDPDEEGPAADGNRDYRWLLFLHSVWENFKGMVTSLSFMVMFQHHRQHPSRPTEVFEWITGGLQRGAEARVLQRWPRAAHRLGSRRRLMYRQQAEDDEIASTIADGVAREIQRLFNPNYALTDLEYLWLYPSIGMETTVCEGLYTSQPCDFKKRDCTRMGRLPTPYKECKSTLRPHLSQRALRADIAQLRRLRAHLGLGGTVDPSTCSRTYPAWGNAMGDGTQGDRPIQVKMGAAALERDGNPVVQEEWIAGLGSLEHEDGYDPREGLLPLLGPTIMGEWPQLNTYEGSLYRVAPSSSGVLRDGTMQCGKACDAMLGLDSAMTQVGGRLSAAKRYLDKCKTEVASWVRLASTGAVDSYRLEDSALVHLVGHQDADADLRGHLHACIKDRVRALLMPRMQKLLVYTKKAELPATVLGAIGVLHLMGRRAEMQMSQFGVVDSSLIDSLVLMIGCIQYVAFGWDRVQSAMKKFFLTGAGKFLRDILTKFGFMCAFPLYFCIGGARGAMQHGFLGNTLPGSAPLWNIVNSLGGGSYVSQLLLRSALYHLRRGATARRWVWTKSILAEMFRYCDITRWPALVSSLLCTNFLELLCTHHHFGMAVQLVRVRHAVIDYRLSGLWCIHDFEGDIVGHEWEFIERVLPEDLIYRADKVDSFMTGGAIDQICGGILRGRQECLPGDNVRMERTKFVSEKWLVQVKAFFHRDQFKTKLSQNIHMNVFLAMHSELKRMKDAIEIADSSGNGCKIDVWDDLETIMHTFLHRFRGAFWPLITRANQADQGVSHQEFLRPYLLGPRSEATARAGMARLVTLQHARQGLLVRGSFVSGRGQAECMNRLSTKLASAMLQTYIANSFELMSNNRRVHLMHDQHLDWARHAAQRGADDTCWAVFGYHERVRGSRSEEIDRVRVQAKNGILLTTHQMEPRFVDSLEQLGEDIEP
ncbi:hypothetical protein M9434_000002 [Picochlorum sp. BPE23]|nr:hypothetical protein M9434_000002 [Picochlorum sp. BPE23]